MSTVEEFEIKVEGNTIWIRGDLDAHTAPQLDEAVATVLADGARHVVLDMSEVAFVDSSGLRSMIGAGVGDDADRSVTVRAPSPATERLLEITGLTEHFEIEAAS